MGVARKYAVWAGFLMALISAGMLFLRSRQEALWGYWPLFLFLGLFAVVFFRRRFVQEGSLHQRRLGWAILSGLMLGLAFPDVVPIGFLAFAAWIPLLRLEYSLREKPVGTSWKALVFYSYPAFVLWNILSTYWVANAALLAGAFAIVVNSALMLLPWTLFHISRRYFTRLGYFPFIAYWLAFEHAHHRWELAWPWLTLGNSLADFPFLVQWYEYTGVLGGSLWILLINVFLFAVLQAQEPDRRRALSMQTAAVLLLPLVASLLRYANYEEKGQKIEVVAVQPNFEPHYEKPKTPEMARMDRMIALAEPLLGPETQFLIYPESSIGYVEVAQLPFYPPVQQFRLLQTRFPQLTLVCGLDAYRILGPDEPSTRATREQQDSQGEVRRFEVMNAALYLPSLNSGQGPEIYQKSKLVPGPELFPYPGALGFLRPLVERLGGTMAGFASQKEREVFQNGAARVGPVICYESVFGSFLGGFVRKGADALFILTNDGWWDCTAGHRQHLKYASLRAIELRRDIARSASTGISCLISQTGDIRQATAYGEATAIKGEIRLNQERTFYSLWGDMIGRLALFMSVLLLLNAGVKAITPGGREPVNG
ncbi:MAG: apolipoprotein N-acyltransferase [Haliscomenobacter sp.]|nr:apolipoprotein N-acyltransferase [Haliscomenobacter sp.]